MSFVDDILARRRRSWPVGHGTVATWDAVAGHDDSQYSPESYGDYLCTSNDVFSVVTARARMLAGLELRFYEGRGIDKKVVDSGRPVELYQYVNPFWTTHRLARMDEISMGLWGESYWALQPPNSGSRVGEIWWLKPSCVRPVPHEKNYLSGYLYYPVQGGSPIEFSASEVVWFRYPNPLDEFSALSPMAAARLAADTGQAMMQANRRLFDQGLQVAGIITPPEKSEEWSTEYADDIERHMKRRFAGAANAHKWAVLRREVQFKQIGVTPKDAEFVAGLNMTFRQVCRAYGMQAALHNDLVDATANPAFERIEWTRALQPDAKFRAEEIREQYLSRFTARRGEALPDHCEFDFTSVAALQDAMTEAWTREAQMVDRGLITGNEWRAWKGLPPLPFLEKPWMPLNKAQPGDDGTLQMPGQDPRLQAAIDAVLAEQGGAESAGGAATMDEINALPDDERNPTNQPVRPAVPSLRGGTHMADRAFLASAKSLVDALALPAHANGHRH